MRRKDVMSVAAADSFNGCARRVHADCSNVRLVRMLLMSFVVVALQLPQPAQAAVVRIPTDSWLLQKSGELDSLPAAAGRQQQEQQQRKLLDIIERLLSYTYGTSNNDDDDDYDWASDDAVITVPEQQLSSEWRQMFDDGGDVIKRSRPLPRRYRQLKRGPGMCINSCLTGGMSFVRCKSMCH